MDKTDIEDFFAAFSRVRVKRMFSGHGVYVEDACFALVLLGDIWIKSDDDSERNALEAVGSEPFNYTRPDGKHVVMAAFWKLPDAALDDEDDLRRWCAPALAAARRTAATKAAARARKAAAAASKPRAAKKTVRSRRVTAK